MMTQDDLKGLLHYDPRTGVFTRVTSPRYGISVGDVAGSPDKYGYLNIRLQGTVYKAHRLAFLWMDGHFPSLDVDHINGVKFDNRWCNLRQVTHSVNLGNRHRPRKDSRSGVTGVQELPSGRYRSKIKIHGKYRHLGCFSTAEEASEAYQEAMRERGSSVSISY